MMPNKEPKLFPTMKTCCVCGAQAPENRGRWGGSTAPYMGITPILYWRGKLKRWLRSCPRLQVCDPCFTKFIAGTISYEKQLCILSALRESLSECYSGLLEDDSE